jgi:hypothetical protein
MPFFSSLLFRGAGCLDVVQVSKLHKTWVDVLQKDRSLPTLLNAHAFLFTSNCADSQLLDELTEAIKQKKG